MRCLSILFDKHRISVKVRRMTPILLTHIAIRFGMTLLKTRMPTGWKLRQIMADRKITNEEVAERVTALTGRSRHWATISRWRQSDVMPKIDGYDLEALCQTLGCTRDELLGDN
jgi:DNA-binding Xre family transcriptional regulator